MYVLLCCGVLLRSVPGRTSVQRRHRDSAACTEGLGRDTNVKLGYKTHSEATELRQHADYRDRKRDSKLRPLEMICWPSWDLTDLAYGYKMCPQMGPRLTLVFIIDQTRFTYQSSRDAAPERHGHPSRLSAAVRREHSLETMDRSPSLLHRRSAWSRDSYRQWKWCLRTP